MRMMQIGTIQFELYRKSIKHLRIRVLPPDGDVRVSAPLKMAATTIQQFVIEHLSWIKKQRDNFARQPKRSPYKMITGEYHYLWGKAYLLEILQHNGRSKIEVDHEKLYLYIHQNASLEKKERVLSNYYRAELKNRVERLLPSWENIIEVSPNFFGIKKMKTRWGSCNTTEKRIWLNVTLAEKRIECLEYVLVHELVHLLEPSHNARFKAFMDKFLPDWRDRRDLLHSQIQ